jgi:hypothetical protein
MSNHKATIKVGPEYTEDKSSRVSIEVEEAIYAST